MNACPPITCVEKIDINVFLIQSSTAFIIKHTKISYEEIYDDRFFIAIYSYREVDCQTLGF